MPHIQTAHHQPSNSFKGFQSKTTPCSRHSIVKLYTLSYQDPEIHTLVSSTIALQCLIPPLTPPHRKVLGRAWEKKKEKEGVGRGLRGNDTNLLLKRPGNELFGAFWNQKWNLKSIEKKAWVHAEKAKKPLPFISLTGIIFYL